jgi:hypothetical protein
VLWLIGITSVWSLVCLVAVSLCVVAGRADQALVEYAPADVPVAALPDDVGFVVALAEPAPEVAHETRPATRTPVH